LVKRPLFFNLSVGIVKRDCLCCRCRVGVGFGLLQVSGSDSPVIDPEVFGGTGFCSGDSSWITVLVLVIRMLIPEFQCCFWWVL